MTCKVCGKIYTPCRSVYGYSGVFNWQEVACSPECGEEYLRQVMIARGELEAPVPFELEEEDLDEDEEDEEDE